MRIVRRPEPDHAPTVPDEGALRGQVMTRRRGSVMGRKGGKDPSALLYAINGKRALAEDVRMADNDEEEEESSL